MSDLTPSYLAYGCHELVNNLRTEAYVQWARETGRFENQECCPTLNACGACCVEDVGYENPIDDAVCWYDPLIPESADFLGIIIEETSGLYDSDYTQSMNETVGSGMSLGRGRHQGKQFGFVAHVFAATCCGMDYALEYLRKTLEDPTGCGNGLACQLGGCSTTCLEVRVCCPEDGQPDSGLRQYLRVGTIDGLKVADQDRKDKCCCTRRKVTFTLASERPESFSSQSTCLDTDASAEFTQCFKWDTCVGVEEPCGPCGNCGSSAICGDFAGIDWENCSTCGDCGFQCEPTLPPPPVLIRDCFDSPLSWAVQCCCPDDLPTKRDTTFKITIETGHDITDPDNIRGLRSMQIKIYDNFAGLPCADTSDEAYALWQQREPCSVLKIPSLPPDSTLVVDGRYRKSTITCKGSCTSANRLVTNSVGSSPFPLVASCSTKMICVEWDENNTVFGEQANGTTLVPAHITIETFAVHK